MGDIDWVKWVAVAAWVFCGVIKMLKIFQLWPASQPQGVTIHNGEYQQMVATLAEIVGTTQQVINGQALITERVDGLAGRVGRIEDRLMLS